MVSTRGPRYKFSEGEKVLCYEPDPTKAKVLYDSKVLEVIKTKDKRGRPVTEYLIHFQGWNSSWDRCVSEDFVLKDTDENRQLQRSLAEKSQLQIGAYLYRKERKKTTGSTSTSSNNNTSTEKRGRKRGLECEGSSSSGDHEERESEFFSQSDSSCTTTDDPKAETPHDYQTSLLNAAINLGPGLRERLMVDFRLVMKQGRVVTLPAKPSVIEILESCVKQYAAKEAAAKSRQRRPKTTNPSQQPQDQIDDLLNKLNLLQEIADGIRVYFDYLLNTHLLYKPEYTQYKEAISKSMIKEARAVREKNDKQNNSCSKPGIKSERLSPQDEYSNLSSSPKIDEQPNRELNREPNRELNRESNKEPNREPNRENQNASARRLRSHKVSQASETQEESPLHSSITPGPSNQIERTSSSMSSSPGPSDTTNFNLANVENISGAIAETIRRVLVWHIVPADNPKFPSAIYGAVHLARLFVKLPEFLAAVNMAEMKLKLIVKYIEIFVDYLEEHEEWFGEIHYTNANPEPS